MRVLVADDDDDIRFVVSALLTRRGCTVTTTSTGVETIDVLRESTFDVLVLDQNMPPGSGLEVIDDLRGRGVRTPAILFTGLSTMVDRSRTGANEVVVMEKTDVASLADRVVALAAGA